MTPPFQYVTVDRILIDQIQMDLEKARSSVVLGYHDSGKGYLRRKLREGLEAVEVGPVIRLNLFHQGSGTDVDWVRERVGAAARAAGLQQAPRGDEILSPLCATGARPILFLSNVDMMPHQLARRILRELRARVDNGELVVLVSGSWDLRDFVYGEGSEFNVAQQFVIQGYGPECFHESLEGYLKVMSLPDFQYPSFLLRLHKLTGGNGELALAILGAYVHHAAIPIVRGMPDGLPDGSDSKSMDLFADWMTQAGLTDARLLRNVRKLLPIDPPSWPELDKLLFQGPPPLPRPAGPPGALTLSGLAVRREGYLHFSSALMEQIAKRFYTRRHIADLYAQAGDWEVAFTRYRTAIPASALRPLHHGDNQAATSTVRMAALTLHKNAAESPATVLGFFCDVCREVLGLPDVFFWCHAKDWRPDPVCAARQGVEGGQAASATLKLARGQEPGPLAIPYPWAGRGWSYLVGKSETDCAVAAFAGDFSGTLVINKACADLLAELFESLRGAYGQAVSKKARERQLRFQRIEDRIVQEILAELGGEIVGVGPVLGKAATLLKDLGYRRIAFHLVDPSKGEIAGIVDNSDVDLSGVGPWQLRFPGSGVHPFVVAMKKPLLVEDAADHPLTDKEAVAKAGITAFAVVPILSRAGLELERVCGTIHVEREDGIVPSEDEISDFLRLGGLLAPLIEHGERIHLLQSSLDQTPNPLLLVDWEQHVRYANRSAGELLGLAPGWRTSGRWNEDDQRSLAPLAEDIAVALKEGRTGHHEKRLGKNRSFVGSLVARRLELKAGQVAGVVVHIENLSYVYRILDALGCVAAAPDHASALAAIVRSAEVLGHPWARLYLVDSTDQPRLVSHVQFGFPDGGDAKAAFESHELTLTRTDEEGEHSWRCIETGEITVYSYTGSNHLFRTKNGLLVHGTTSSCRGHLAKQRGDYWLDVPLLAEGKVIGKITIGCDEHLLPERFDFLTTFFRLAATLLHVHAQHEEASAALVDLRQQQAGRLSLALISHNLATRMAGLSPLINLYELLEGASTPSEGALDELVRLNSIFRREYKAIDAVLQKAKDTFREAPPQWGRADLLAVVKSVVALVPAGGATVIGPSGLEADLDKLQIEGALKEIVQNSVDFCDPPKIAVTIETFSREGAEWIRLLFADHGPGVIESYKARIFEDFFTHRPGRDPGTGLGLALVRRVITAHGGAVDEIGTAGQGATFRIEIPRFRQLLANKEE